MEQKKDFTRNREDKAEFKNVFFIKLLFTEKPKRPDTDVLKKAAHPSTISPEASSGTQKTAASFWTPAIIRS